MSQRFIASVRTTCPNGAIGWAPGGLMDCLGPFAKVQNCPVMINGKEVARLTCYASGHADTWFSVPANTRFHGRYITGYFASTETGTEFRPHDSHKAIFTA